MKQAGDSRRQLLYRGYMCIQVQRYCVCRMKITSSDATTAAAMTRCVFMNVNVFKRALFYRSHLLVGWPTYRSPHSLVYDKTTQLAQTFVSDESNRDRTKFNGNKRKIFLTTVKQNSCQTLYLGDKKQACRQTG